MAIQQPTRFTNAVHFAGAVSFGGTFTPPTGSITNASIVASAGIDASKVNHKFPLRYAQAPGSAIVAGTQDLHVVAGATGAIESVEAAITGAIATGGDRTVTIDIQKSTGGGAFATVLSATIQFDNGDTLRTASAGTVSDADLVDGDILRVVVTVAGAAGAQAEGLIVTLFLQETPS